MRNTTKAQHYVWRYYLSPWTEEHKSEGRIHVAMKKQGGWSMLGESSKGLIPLTSIAFQNFLYDLSEATDIDFGAAKLLTDSYLQKLFPNREYNSDYSQIYNKRNQRDFLEKEYISKIEESSIKYLDRLRKGELPYKELKYYALRKELTSDILAILMHGKDDSSDRGTELKEALVEISNNSDEKFEFYEFMALQMLRTKYAKKLLNN